MPSTGWRKRRPRCLQGRTLANSAGCASPSPPRGPGFGNRRKPQGVEKGLSLSLKTQCAPGVRLDHVPFPTGALGRAGCCARLGRIERALAAQPPASSPSLRAAALLKAVCLQLVQSLPSVLLSLCAWMHRATPTSEALARLRVARRSPRPVCASQASRLRGRAARLSPDGKGRLSDSLADAS